MTKRSYGQYCGLARTLDIVGERWTLLIIRDLMGGPRRYSDLLDSLRGIGTSLLAQRLKHLEAEGLVTRGYLPPPAASTVYELTEEGRELARAMRPLVAWGARRLGRPSRREVVRIEWIVRFLASTCDESRSAGVHETYEFRLPQGTFHVEVDDGTLNFAEGPAGVEPDLVVETDLDVLAALGMGRPLPDDARARLKTTGSRAVAERALRILSPALDDAADRPVRARR